MKLKIIALIGLGLLAGSVFAADPELKSQQDKVSYSIGLNIGGNFKKQNIELNYDLFVKGIKDGVAGTKPLLDEAQVREVMMTFQKEMMAKQEERNKTLSDKNKKEGDTFLADNKKKEGVKVTASGLQYRVIKEGTGEIPKATDTVVTNYKGTLLDGTEFDSSYKRGEPATFPVTGVIKGWTEALQLMKVGSKWQLFIPSDLAYGEKGAGRDIGPNATLIFEIELVSIKAGS
jgi:FKBP-type peptidyl-prolyl cis-trans isomerase FklB